ncbi:hypothetical protein [Halomontanus rarus]|uniref:hypothetical protein n=1 Tax=Halomontanus rarus TaxID=3034020 RepID=UPI00307C631B
MREIRIATLVGPPSRCRETARNPVDSSRLRPPFTLGNVIATRADVVEEGRLVVDRHRNRFFRRRSHFVKF